MEDSLFRRFCDIAYQRAGIALKEGKEALVAARVAKRVRALGLGGAKEYLRLLEADERGDEYVHFLDSITTNFTRFYREPDHFDRLSEFLAERYDAGQRKFRLWCAAASSGEEPYTLAITVAEALAAAGADGACDVKILATDISTRMLERAREGVYDEERVAPVPRALRHRWFESAGRASDGGRRYRASQRLRDILVFARLNLAVPPFPMKGPLDAVFCRNVMIYFDNAVRQRLVTEIERLLAPCGLLFLGHTETLTGVRSGLRPLRPSVYRSPAPRSGSVRSGAPGARCTLGETA